MPDIPGCFSTGETLDEALAQATEAIECRIEGLMLGGESILIPHDNQQHRDDSKRFTVFGIAGASLRPHRALLSSPIRLQWVDVR